MANPNILLNGLRPAQGVQSAMLGAQQGNQVAQMPMRNRLLEAQTQGAELSNQAAEQQMTRQQAEFMLKDAAIDAIKIKELAQTDPMRAQVAIAHRIKKIQGRGGDPSDTLGLLQALTEGNMNVVNSELDAVISGAQQAGLLNSVSNIPTAIQDRNDLIGRLPKDAQGNLLPVEQMNAEQKAIAVEAGLIPRAGVVTGTQREATDPALGEQVTGYVSGQAGAKAGASEQAKLQEQYKMRPEIESAVTSAKALATQQADEFATSKSNDKAMQIYDAAIGNMFEKLGKAWTGPGMGWLPAIGDDARIAEGAIAVMAPVLKSLFRVSGEGTFTKDDQDRLMAMLPGRGDRDEVVAAKLDAVDLVVRAMLGQGKAPRTFSEKRAGVSSSTPPPAGIDPSLLEFMTPEERALFE